MKFTASLCARCNNERSQPVDRAWDAFTTYLAANEPQIVASRSIDLASVYGAAWRGESANLAR